MRNSRDNTCTALKDTSISRRKQRLKNKQKKKEKKMFEQKPDGDEGPGGRVSLAGRRASAKALRYECTHCVYRMAREPLFMLLSRSHSFPCPSAGEILS